MTMTIRVVFLIMVVGLPAGQSGVFAQQREGSFLKSEGRDKPKIAVIQYESGRVLVVREVGGGLQVIEPSGDLAAAVQRYLDFPVKSRYRKDEPEVGSPPHATGQVAEDPLFFNPQWYGYQPLINTNVPNDASYEGRATERYKQKAAERRQGVKARRAEQGTPGVTNRAGRVYPSTAGDQEQADRLASVRSGVVGSPYVTFYSLGDGLEYYRQQDLAARRELALLTYDVLLEEGLKFFHQRQYGRAARSFIGATQKDRGDAGSRLHAAQALLANGLYAEAMVHIRRAFELAPQLVHRPLNHGNSYSEPRDFLEHLLRLKAYAQAHPDDDEAWILLAYEQFFSDRPQNATEAMRRVRNLARTDRFAWKLWTAAKPVLGELE